MRLLKRIEIVSNQTKKFLIYIHPRFRISVAYLLNDALVFVVLLVVL
jgi:hypothetical protein